VHFPEGRHQGLAKPEPRQPGLGARPWHASLPTSAVAPGKANVGLWRMPDV